MLNKKLLYPVVLFWVGFMHGELSITIIFSCIFHDGSFRLLVCFQEKYGRVVDLVLLSFLLNFEQAVSKRKSSNEIA